MTGTHRRSTSIDKSSTTVLAVPYPRRRAGSVNRDRSKPPPNPLAEMAGTFVNSPSPLKRSDALPDLLSLEHTGSPSVARSKRFHKLRNQPSVDNFTGPGHRDSPFGTPHAILNPSAHVIHPQQKSVRAPHPLSRSSINSISRYSAAETSSSNRHMADVERSKLDSAQRDNHFTTPDAFKSVKPLATAFMSTGLLSKRNQPLEHLKFGKPTPDTPCKRPLLGIPPSPGTPGTPATPLAMKEFLGADANRTRTEDTTTDDYLFLDNEGDSSLLYASSSSEFDGTPHTPTRSLFTQSNGFTTDQQKRRRSLLFGRSPAEDEGYFLHTMAEIPFGSPHPTSLPGSLTRSNVAQPYADVLSSVPRTNPDHFASSPVTGMPFGTAIPPDLRRRFKSVERLAKGQFSDVYLVEDTRMNKFAVKRSRAAYSTEKNRARMKEEVLVLQHIGKHEHIIEYLDSWEDSGHLYIQTEYCENGSLDVFLRDLGRTQRLDEFRVWKILTEVALGLCFIHDQGFVHLDLKPANFFITFEGVLKIGDFGLSVHESTPAPAEREGDRVYMAPEALRDAAFGKPADIFSLGITILEVAGNIVLPHNGVSWHKLRSGDLSDVPKLSTLDVDTHPRSVHEQVTSHRYMGQGGLERAVIWMCSTEPESRPTVQEILNIEEVIWVNQVRRAGAIIYEGDRGPDTSGDHDIYMVNEESAMDVDGQDWRMEM